MVLVTGGSENAIKSSTSSERAVGVMDKAWGVTVAPPPSQQHKRHDPAPWHKHDISEKERAKQLRKLFYVNFLY